MKCNVGKTERIVRIVAALACMALGAGWWNGFYLAAVILFLTAMVAWCPVSALLGLSSCPDTEQEEIPADTVSTDKDRVIRERRFK